jgi:hypothetical protein
MKHSCHLRKEDNSRTWNVRVVLLAIFLLMEAVLRNGDNVAYTRRKIRTIGHEIYIKKKENGIPFQSESKLLSKEVRIDSVYSAPRRCARILV